MRRQRADAQVVPYPSYQRFAAAAYRSVRGKPMMHGLVEVDVSVARSALRQHKVRTGESLSFTSFLVGCLGKAVDEHPAVQALRQGGGHLVLFQDVDVAVRVEREVAGRRYVIPHIIRAANRKGLRQLHDEIRAAQVADVGAVVTRPRLVPPMLFGPFVWAFTTLGRRRPSLWRKAVGTVGITSVGMFGSGPGWGIPPPFPTALVVTVGGIGERAVTVDGHPAVREHLCLTVSVDHEIVDGAPAARFTRRLKELIEGGYGLGDVVAPTPVGRATNREGA